MVIALKLDKNVKKSGLNSVYFNVSNGKSGQFNQIRKRIYPNLEVNLKQFDVKNFRAKSTHPNYSIINKRIEELRSFQSVAQTKFDAGQYNTEQVILHLKGETDVESVDSYLDTFVKKQKAKNTTYLDYKATLGAFRKHMGYDKNRPVTFNELTNYSTLVEFRNNALKKVKATSFNSYLKKIKAICNDAYDNQVIFERPYFSKRLSINGAERKEAVTLESDKFLQGIKSCEQIFELQAMCIYLLSFMTRGMYISDLVKFKSIKLRNEVDEEGNNINDFYDNDDYTIKLCQDGYDYIVHDRSKNEGRSNVRMVIRVDTDTLTMFTLMKRSIWCTHYDRRKEFKLNDNDPLSFIAHDVDNTNLHKGFYDVFQKHIREILDVPAKSARATFNNYARKLKISEEMRNVLLGHSNQNVIKHYDDLSFIENEIHNAHISVLNEYNVSNLVKAIQKQFVKINAGFITEPFIILDLKNWAKHYSKAIDRRSPVITKKDLELIELSYESDTSWKNYRKSL